MADNFVKGIVYQTNYWIEKDTNKAFTKCLKCGSVEYLDKDHTKCSKCGEEFGDYHNDFIESDTVEKMAWSYLANISNKVEKAISLSKSTLDLIKGNNVDLNSLLNDINVLGKHHLGFSHTYFLPEFGCPVESEVERKTIEFNGIKYPDITWKCGFIVNDELFEKIQNGEINSFSFGGMGKSRTLFEIEDN